MYNSVVRDSGLGVLGRCIIIVMVYCNVNWSDSKIPYLHAYKRCFLLSIHYLAAIRDFL